MAETRLVGPFPEGKDAEDYDRQRRRILWAMPSGLYVLGSRAGDRRNLMTLNWACQVAMDPKLMAVSVEAGAVTRELVADGGCFSLNLIKREDRSVVRKFVKPLDADLGGFEVHTAATGAPILELAAAWLDCVVKESLVFASHTLFVGEVVDCGGEVVGVEILRMEDTRMSYGG